MRSVGVRHTYHTPHGSIRSIYQQMQVSPYRYCAVRKHSCCSPQQYSTVGCNAPLSAIAQDAVHTLVQSIQQHCSIHPQYPLGFIHGTCRDSCTSCTSVVSTNEIQGEYIQVRYAISISVALSLLYAYLQAVHRTWQQQQCCRSIVVPYLTSRYTHICISWIIVVSTSRCR